MGGQLNLTARHHFSKECFDEWPRPRERAVTWFTGSAMFLFGGWGQDWAENVGELNDLWQYVGLGGLLGLG